MSKTALIGYTGFVGSNLIQNSNIDFLFNTTNIGDLCNQEYDLVYCAAPSAVKWLANRDPIKDLEIITKLLLNLEKLKTKKFVLFSTIDVYGDNIKNGLDENTELSINTHPYGKNRYLLENYVNGMFDTTIIRLPGLYGNNLKKNILYDLKNNNLVSNISLESEYQWFNLKYAKDIVNFAINNKINVLNCATEPVKTFHIVERYYPDKLKLCNGNNVIKYDIKTCYYKNNYFYDKEFVISDLGGFLK